MRICLILEGCYPYVFGGVATWVNQYILSKPEHEFVIFTIGAEKKKRKVCIRNSKKCGRN